MVTIQTEMVEKINYLLRRFDDTEWSGPAWYKLTKTLKNGFPIKVELVHFIPIHLGESAETEIDGETLGKLLPKVYKKYDHLKECFLGLIHSHHTMGAFFSGTDKDTALEQAPAQGLFFTTVVASSKKKFATGMAYRDQFGYSNFIEGKIKHHFKYNAQKQWIAEATSIKKQADEEAKTAPVSSFGYNYNQGSFFGGHNVANRGVVVDRVERNYITGSSPTPVETQYYSSNGVLKQISGKIADATLAESLTDEQMEKIADIYTKWEIDEIDDQKFMDDIREVSPDIDPYWFIDSMSQGNLGIV